MWTCQDENVNDFLIIFLQLRWIGCTHHIPCEPKINMSNLWLIGGSKIWSIWHSLISYNDLMFFFKGGFYTVVVPNLTS
jgi:hypothetical protein